MAAQTCFPWGFPMSMWTDGELINLDTTDARIELAERADARKRIRPLRSAEERLHHHSDWSWCRDDRNRTARLRAGGQPTRTQRLHPGETLRSA